MNSIDKEYFTKLHNDRADTFKAIDKPGFRGVMDTIASQYSDAAHFIYELLQNADDVEATDVWINLKRDKLTFAHNGKKHFNISNPETEEEDAKNNRLGDINSICSVAQSTKRDAVNKIGKFGIGFKSVFNYTKSPSIYDTDIQFKIINHFVPELIDDDRSIRENDNYTYFVIPFNLDDKDPVESYEEVSEKLTTLVYPSLFLNNLKTIYCEYENKNVIYTKKISKTIDYKDKYQTKGMYITLTKDDDNEEIINNLWLFERKLENGLTYAVGFFLDDDGNLKKETYDTFSYFLTKEKTNLSFIIEAPFRLSPSRETVEGKNKHNIEMVDKLSDLAADSLIYLRDIGLKEKHLLITDNTYDDIIPYDESVFVTDQSRLSFYPFYEKIKNKISKEELFPTKDNYVNPANSYWAYEPEIPKMFEDDIKIVTDNDKAEWVFRSFGFQHKKTNLGISGKRFFNYISDMLDNPKKQLIENEKILTSNYFGNILENHDVSWIKRLYGFIEEKKRSVDDFIRETKIFLDKDGKASAAFDENDQEILFLPTDEETEYNTVNENLLKDKDIEKFIRNFGIKEPSKMNHIYNVILKKCETGLTIGSKDFNYIFNFSRDCSAIEREELINVLKNKEFISCVINGKTKHKPELPKNVYLPTDELLYFFEGYKNVAFVNDTWLSDNDKEDKINFLREVGCRDTIKIKEKYISKEEAKELSNKFDITFPKHNNDEVKPSWKIKYIEGLNNCLNNILESEDYNKSVLLWNLLVAMIEKDHIFALEYSLSGKYTYRPNKHRRTDDSKSFKCEDGINLINYKWIFNNKKEMIAPEKSNADSLALDYNLQSEGSRKLIEFFDMEDSRYINLTEDDKKKIELGSQIDNLCEEFGISKEEAMGVLKQYGDKKSKLSSIEFNKTIETKVDIDEELDQKTEAPTKKIYREIELNRQRFANGELTLVDEETNEEDEDDYLKLAVDYKKEIDKQKKKSALEIERISESEELQNRAIASDKYSYEWFKCLLNLEMNAKGDADNLKTTYIRFGSVRKEEGTDKTIILEQPFGHVNPDLEELSDIPLFLESDGKTKNLFIEALSVQSYVVRAKLRSSKELEDVKLEEVTSAKLEIKNPIFLLKELRDRYYELPFSNKDNLKNKLPENIEFVFGPPGTGKTTYLANDILIPLMKDGNEKTNILVLTPTNKAADVIVNRICSLMGDESYQEWLIRFGLTFDPSIEKSYLYKDKHVDIKGYKKSITVTTIQRFSYDFFIPGNQENYYIRDVDWDYIVIDEASMISLAYIVYPLFKNHPKKFIIAGDPFQIEPIVSVDMWKDENIYKMVNLNSFSKPRTLPYSYKVKTLTTQYRSIPSIGNVFSTLTYNGILKHSRTASEKKHINFGDDFNFASINMIKYPVSCYESIYSSKRLGSSSYHVYAALFVYEFTKYIIKQVSVHNKENISIGIISPYKAQADIIKKLLVNINIPKNIEVQAGTIHSFQGDECDIIIDMFNTPGNKMTNPNIFANRLNIINVALSRARDYLFIVMPNEETDGIENLTVMNKVKSIFRNTKDYIEIDAKEIEKTIFNSETYFEDNSFVTGHQNVNIYSQPEKVYEIRAEDTAVDIQIHLDSEEPMKQISSSNNKVIVSNNLIELKKTLEDSLNPEDFSIREKPDEDKISVIYLGSALFDVEDSTNGDYIVYTKGRYLNSIYLDKKVNIEYHPDDIVKFRIIVPYDDIDEIIDNFAEIGEIYKVNDEEAYETLKNLKYNVKIK